MGGEDRAASSRALPQPAQLAPEGASHERGNEHHDHGDENRKRTMVGGEPELDGKRAGDREEEVEVDERAGDDEEELVDDLTADGPGKVDPGMIAVSITSVPRLAGSTSFPATATA